MLVDLKDMEIKKLSEIYDIESRDSFVSLYINMEKTNERFVEKRTKACRSVLKENRDLMENFDKTMLKIEKYLSMNDREDGQKGLAIFASNEHDLFITYKLGVPVEDLMVVDTSPYIRPLARMIEDYETFGLVVLDNHRARIYVVSSGRIEDITKIARDIMKKHKKGGMSQARFQRLRVGAIEHFLKEVADEMEKIFSKDNIVKIVIAGPGNAKIMLKDFLPNELKNEILDLIDVDFDEADGDLISIAEEAVQKDKKETVSKNVIRLKEEILKCGIEFAQRTNTKIEFVDDNPILQELGGVGGLLRFKI